MAIAVTCEACGQKINAPDGLAGQLAPCSSCQAPVNIPAPRARPKAPPIDYEMKGASRVRYNCPQCNELLSSTIADAGGVDQCPSCDYRYVVPGEDAKSRHAKKQRQLSDKKVRAAESRKTVEEQRRAETKARTVERAAVSTKHQLQLDRDPMKEWWWYAVIGLTLMLATTGQHIFAGLTSDDTFLCALILCLFAIGITMNYLGVRQLRVEYVCAAACMDTIKNKGGFKEVFAGAPAGVFHKHIQDLAAIASHDDDFTQDNLVSLLYSRLMARSKIVEILSGVLVSLGLIGTVLGLIIMTNGLGETLASLDGNESDLLTGMRATMAGLGTAFYTTLVGAILGSVALRVMNNVYTSNVDHLVTYVASTTEVRIIPMLKKLSRASQVKA